MNKKQTPTDEQLTAYLIQQIDIELSKPLDEQDMHYIDECNEFLKQINGDKYMPDPERKQQQIEELRKRVVEESLGYTFRFKRIGKRTVAILCAIVAILCASILVTSAISRTSPLAVIEKWGRALFNIPYDEEIVENEMTFIRNGDVKQYGSIDELLEQEQLNILIPTWLPDGVRITEIVWLGSDQRSTINIIFNVDSILVNISLNDEYYNNLVQSVASEEIEIDERICFLLPTSSVQQLVFCDRGYTYSVSANDVNLITNLVKGME